MPLIKLIPIRRCRDDGGTFLEYDGRELAVFLLNDPRRAVVIDNACPHSAGNLSAGEVAGNTVTCPWHHWRFDLDRGVCTNATNVRLRRYETEIRDGDIWIDLPNGSEGPITE